MTDQTVNFGLLADTRSQLERLKTVVESSGHTVSESMLAITSNLKVLADVEVDIWIVQTSMQSDENAYQFLDALDNLEKPVIFDDVESISALQSEDRAKRLTQKIHSCAHEAGEKVLDKKPAKEIWVLAASTGGPEAVAQFLRGIADEYRNVAFLYAQHINVGYEGSLQTMVMRNSTLTVYDSDRPRLLRAGALYIVSPRHQIELDESGWMTPVEKPWPGCYSPSMDLVIAKVARRYGRRSGAIIFSGMGNDGSGSCVFMKHSGGKVWAQTPNTCAVDSMPAEAIRTNVVGLIASPQQLALKFIQHNRMTT